MVQVNRTGKHYADNLIDPYLTFDTTQTWTVSSGTGSSGTDDVYAFNGTKSLAIINNAPTTDIVVTNATQNTVYKRRSDNCVLSFYLLKNDSSYAYTGEVKIFKNSVLLDTQEFSLATTEDGEWYRFVSDTTYAFAGDDVITFTFQLDGIVGHGGVSVLYIDGIMLNVLGDRLDYMPAIYTVPSEHVPSESFGIYDYNDDATSTTPISLLANTWTHVTNDGAGAFTNTTYGLTGISNLYDTSSGLFDWSDLELGDTVAIRFDADITTSGANQSCDVDLVLAYGTGSEYRIPFVRNNFKTAGA